jgi:hypothetical protein
MKYLMALAVAIALGAVATAHPHNYVNVTGDLILDCDDSNGFSQGGVCIATGHVAADATGGASVTVVDDNTSPVSAYYCQDLDGDQSCGDFATPFCATMNIQSGSNWDQSSDIIVFIDGPVFGNPVLSACGSLSIGVTGTVTHS